MENIEGQKPVFAALSCSQFSIIPISIFPPLVRPINPGPPDRAIPSMALPLWIFKKSRWGSHKSGVKPGSQAPDSPIQTNSLLFEVMTRKGHGGLSQNR